MFIRFSVPVPPKIEIYRTHLIERGWDIGRYNLCHWKCYSHHDQQLVGGLVWWSPAGASPRQS